MKLTLLILMHSNYMYRLSNDISEETQKSQQLFIHGESAAQRIMFIKEEPHTVL